MNPYLKFMGKEDHLQHAVMEYLKRQYPKVLAFHVPNEAKRSSFERFKAKYLGVLPGVSDVIIIHNGEVLAIELKIKPNKATKNQQDFLEKINQAGFIGIICYDFLATKRHIDYFLKAMPQIPYRKTEKKKVMI